MATYKVRSIMISKAGPGSKLSRPCMVSLFDVHNPHKSGKAPKKVLMFDNVEEVTIPGAGIRFLLAGNDILLEKARSVHISKKGKKLIVKAR